MFNIRKKYYVGMLFVFFLYGCAPTVKLSKKTPAVESIQFAESQIKDSLVIIDQYEVFDNGGKADLNKSSLNYMVKIFRKSNLFTNVVYKKAVSNAKNNFTFNITIRNELDTNVAGNAGKAFLVGLSLHLLSPVLKSKYNYSSTMVLEVIRSDGNKRTYEVTTDAKSYIEIEMPSGSAINAVRSDVLINNYNMMISKIADDLEFFQSSRGGQVHY